MFNKINKPHGIMFHHLHGKGHPKSQGSISQEDFKDIIEWLRSKYTLLNAEEFIIKLQKKKLKNNEICLTFDDALLCQYDLAAPILKNANISAFFFIYSAPLQGEINFLEIYRLFRTTQYADISEFYNCFFSEVNKIVPKEYNSLKRKFENEKYLADFPFYSDDDKWFRYTRDRILDCNSYLLVMEKLMASKNFDYISHASNLWMNNHHIRDLQADGHNIGMHSHSHPTAFHLLDNEMQTNEYSDNFSHLSKVMGFAPNSMSHPCGNYSPDTLKILKDMNIQIGFRSSMSPSNIFSNLEVPREDHANILNEMSK